MQTAWDKNAEQRHRQMIEGKDISFSRLLLPEILRLLHSFGGYASFSVVDVGCGTGVLTRILARQVQEVVGVEPSSTSVRIAREYTKNDANVSIEASTIQDCQALAPDSFDLAIAHMVLQTMDPLDRPLEVIAGALKQSGIFMFTVPHPCFWAEIRSYINKSEYSYNIPSTHQIPFTITTVSEPLPSFVPYYHRPLETYSTALGRSGFLIEQIREPFPDQNLLREYSRPWKYPGFLLLVCRKQTREEAKQ